MDIIESAEEYLASYLGVRHTLLTSAGRTALVVALKALGIGLGDDVVMPSFTCDAVIKSVEFCGAKPVFADVDSLTFNVNPLEIERHITTNTKVILVIHCYGQPAHMDEIVEIAERKNISIIEDVAHSVGAKYHGQKVGGFGDLSIFSFSKNMNCSSGGALATNSDDLIYKAEEIFSDLCASENALSRFVHSVKDGFLNLGRKERFLLSSVKLLGIARKLAHNITDDVPRLFSANDQIASEIIASLRSIDKINNERKGKARVLTTLIDDLKLDYITPPFEKHDRMHVYYIYGLKAWRRKNVFRKLGTVEKYTFLSLPWQCPYRPQARKLSEQLILFEMNPSLNEEVLRSIVSALVL